MRLKFRNASRIAAGQHGCVTTGQLLDAGFSRAGVVRLAAKRLLHREFQGVWRLGHAAPSIQVRYMAAVLACGPGAALSGLAAAFHLGLIRRPPPLIEVSHPKERDIPGIPSRRRQVPSRERHGIPASTLQQVIRDLAGHLSLDDLAQLCHQAEVIYGVTRVPTNNVKGAAKLRAIYDGDHALLLSEMERAFKRLLEAAGLPLPHFNRKKAAAYIDARYEDPPITIELQSYRHHSSRAAWENDFERQRAARRRGDAFLPLTWRDVVETPAETVAELRRLL